MSTLSASEVVAQLRWRYAVKKFDSTKKISDADWAALEQSLVLAPSSFGLQPWKFVVVSDPAIKAKLPAISWGQTQPAECSHMVVFAARKQMADDDIDKLLTRTAELRGQAVAQLDGYRKMMAGFFRNPALDHGHWAALQTYIALGQFMAVAAVMGIDTCPMEGIVADQYDALFGLTEQGYRTTVACVAGYRASDDKYAALPKVRYADSDVLDRR